MLNQKILPFIITLLAAPFLINAQVTNGSVTGTVKDSQGKDLPSATVEVVHVCRSRVSQWGLGVNHK
jgi:hypothetical protein